MDSKSLFREHGATGMPRRMRPLGLAAGEWLLTALLCALVLGLFALGSAIDEQDAALEALALAERAELQAARECVLAQGTRP